MSIKLSQSIKRERRGRIETVESGVAGQHVTGIERTGMFKALIEGIAKHDAARRLVLMLGVWLCALGVAVLLSAVPASALIVHDYETSFGGAGSGSGQFSTPTGVAVNDTTHDVYVVDRGNNRVEEFNSTGSVFLGEFDGAASPTGVFSNPERIAVDNSGSPIDPSAGDVYVVDNGHNVIDKFSASGVYEGQLTARFGELGAIAVDSSGTLWVVDGGEIDSFSDAQQNEYLSKRGTAYGAEITGEGSSALAVDPKGDLYVKARRGFLDGSHIVKVNGTGETLVAPFSGAEAFGVAVGSVEREVYVAYDFAGATPVEALGLDGTRIETFGSGHIGNAHAVAVDASNSTVYVTDIREERVDVFKGFHLPTVSAGSLSEQTPRSVTLNGTVNPEGEQVVSCAFEYGTTSSYGQSVPCSPSPGSSSTPVVVSAHVTGLTPGVTYHYRLVASDSAGASPTPDREFVAGPIASDEFLTEVTSESAVLHAGINPNNGDTQYYFEFGPTTAYGTDVPLAPPGLDLGAGSVTVPVSFHLHGLQAGVTYHYRLAVTQAGEMFEGPDRTFTTQATGGNGSVLPDRRAWELVSPADKGGALIGPLQNPPLHGQAAVEGDGIAYAVNQPLGEGAAGRSGVGGEAFSQHGAAGWGTRSITSPEALPPAGEYEKATIGVEYFMLFSPDLSVAALEPRGAFSPQIEGVGERTDLLRNNISETYVPLVTPENVPTGTKIAGEENGLNPNEQMHMEAMTPDLSHVILQSAVALAPGAVPTSNSANNLYEWSEGQLQFIGEGVVGNGPTIFQNQMTARAISNDGRWVVITQHGEAGGVSPVQYVVHDGVKGTSAPFGGQYAYFQTMSNDGSRVFFLETEPSSKRQQKEQGELYVFDPVTGITVALTADHLDGEANANVQNTVVASEDGSYVYFVATGVLAPGATPGADNFYVLHYDGERWTTAFIGTLSSEDRPDWKPGDTKVETWTFELDGLDTRVSPNGQEVAFMSDRSLTGYDNVDAVSGHRDEEVYLYDVADGSLKCVSCNPTGARPVGILDSGRQVDSSALLIDGPRAWEEKANQTVPVDSWVAGVLPSAWHKVGQVDTYQPRYVFDGGRLFFQSTDALVPQDTNGVADVYEYEPVKGPGMPASDDCMTSSPTFSQAAGGCVSLISSGQSSSESAFVDAGETGNDVFFVTNSKLVGEDYDNVYDMYDAHACGSGWNCGSSPVSPPACTSGDSCKPAPSPQPVIFGPAPSETFNGTGNLTPLSPAALKAKRKLCAKDRVRRRGVCMKVNRKAKRKRGKGITGRAHKSVVYKRAGGSGR